MIRHLILIEAVNGRALKLALVDPQVGSVPGLGMHMIQSWEKTHEEIGSQSLGSNSSTLQVVYEITRR